ncbi:DUF5996 family protein [Parvularcula maris]|uniref:DUF5996 family protein n=1 Tax=Parvularcula maris TaxID=2965077 RepID=A0A9X2LA32_9PROT|nr:DUF5996 family protein [Parvularcula maris]MCQ8185918.1 DUF5996 family protein [Parvularcula maris]
MTERWPAIPYTDWKETAAALHLQCQILGKYRLAHTPWVNHSWHATLYPVPSGLTTGPVHDGEATITLGLDFKRHLVTAENMTGEELSFPLEPMSIAAFLTRTEDLIVRAGGRPVMHGAPNELPDATPFAEDTAERPYDREAVQRFHRALLSVAGVFERFRTAYLGKVSPVHLFWGSFDLAVTRFSGRSAPLHPGGVPNLPDAVTREAYSHEVSSAGFWPGGGGVEEAMFYSYAYPAAEGFDRQPVHPEAARFDEKLGEFVLPYEAVRRAEDPESALLDFLQSTYEAAAVTADWDRSSLECAIGRPRVPRQVG